MILEHPCRRVAALGLAAAAALAGGCASVHVDEQGRRHVLGWVWMTLPAPAVQPLGAETLRVRSLGVTLSSSPLGQAAVIGWSDHSLTAVRNDSAVRLDPPDTGAPR